MSSFRSIAMIMPLMLSSCVTRVFEEEITPAGSVPQAEMAPDARAPLGRSSPAGAIGRSTPSSGQVDVGQYGAEKKADLDKHLEIVRRFATAYQAAGAPRIAVFLNRELSADVREWRSDGRLVISGAGSLKAEAAAVGASHATAPGTSATSVAGEGAIVEGQSDGDGASIAAQQFQYEDVRSAPSEEWMWKFEEGFLRPLIEANAKMIDRATIMRLSADYEVVDDKHNPASVKKVEIDALKNHAEIYVELLVTASSESPYGYVFRCVAKEVDTGIIVTNVTSIPIEEPRLVATMGGVAERQRAAGTTREIIVETEEGFEVQVDVPPLRVASESLALEMMTSLAQRWLP